MTGDTISLEYRGYTTTLRKDDNTGRYQGYVKMKIADFNNNSYYYDDIAFFGDSIADMKHVFEQMVDEEIETEQMRQQNQAWRSITDHISIGYVFQIYPNLFEKRIKEGLFDESLLTSVKGWLYEVPLYYVTKAWDVLLKGSLPNAFEIGFEEENEDEYTEEEVAEFMANITRTRCEACHDNDRMKAIWKTYFNIDIDALEIDFHQFNMHIPPKVTHEECMDYFTQLPDGGITEWILTFINCSETDSYTGSSIDTVSSLMEYVAYVLYFREEM